MQIQEPAEPRFDPVCIAESFGRVFWCLIYGEYFTNLMLQMTGVDSPQVSSASERILSGCLHVSRIKGGRVSRDMFSSVLCAAVPSTGHIQQFYPRDR